MLYLVATPIGNLADVSQRALTVLRGVDYIAAEDTRHSKKLLNQFGITTPIFSYHEHNEKSRGKMVLEKLKAGKDIALISDAGTPLISDPGYKLVKEAHNAGIQVIPIPGAVALITALTASGLPTDKFVFEGFLPAKSTARHNRLTELQTETRTLIFYESTHRILATIAEMVEVFGSEREAVIARELTKKFETIHNATLGELAHWLSTNSQQQKGEFVILLHGADKKIMNPMTKKMLQILVRKFGAKTAVELTAQITGEKKNVLKKLLCHCNNHRELPETT